MSTAGLGPGSARQSMYDIESLCKEYCPPLEAGLVYAIASDFDLGDAKSLREIKTTLDELKSSAVVEQELELLPHDEGHQNFKTVTPVVSGHEINHEATTILSEPSRSFSANRTEDDGIVSVTTDISGLKCSDVDGSDLDLSSGYGEAGVDFENLSDIQKTKWLCTMFPSIKQQDITDVLARCEGNFDRSTDELLNLSFLRENNEDPGSQEYVVPKGIDAFMQETEGKSRRKGKGKGRRSKIRTDHDMSEAWASDSAVSSGVVTPNVWKDLPEDIEFIASRTFLKPKVIASVYHANGARISPTIRAFAIKEGEIYVKAPEKVDEIMEWQMDELRNEFTNVSDAQIYGMLTLTRNIPSAAKELLEIMLISNEQPVLLGKITGLASYTPLDLSEDEPTAMRSSSGIRPRGNPISGGVYTTSHLANAHGIAATQAFQQASAAYRRGKSDHLMGGAAAYYASVGHEKLKAAKSIQSAAADAHVAAQSSATVLDLHGVNVSDAVRIAQRGAETWWDRLGDRKYVVGGRGNGYRIVTGVGRHSSDGRGRIGPAVSKMLVREGWKIEVGTGEVVVSGKSRK